MDKDISFLTAQNINNKHFCYARHEQNFPQNAFFTTKIEPTQNVWKPHAFPLFFEDNDFACCGSEMKPYKHTQDN